MSLSRRRRTFTYAYELEQHVFWCLIPTIRRCCCGSLKNFGLEIENETVYLSPYLSWIVKPTSRFFHQGFLQIEVAANPRRSVLAV